MPITLHSQEQLSIQTKQQAANDKSSLLKTIKKSYRIFIENELNKCDVNCWSKAVHTLIAPTALRKGTFESIKDFDDRKSKQLKNAQAKIRMALQIPTDNYSVGQLIMKDYDVENQLFTGKIAYTDDFLESFKAAILPQEITTTIPVNHAKEKFSTNQAQAIFAHVDIVDTRLTVTSLYFPVGEIEYTLNEIKHIRNKNKKFDRSKYENPTNADNVSYGKNTTAYPKPISSVNNTKYDNSAIPLKGIISRPSRYLEVGKNYLNWHSTKSKSNTLSQKYLLRIKYQTELSITLYNNNPKTETKLGIYQIEETDMDYIYIKRNITDKKPFDKNRLVNTNLAAGLYLVDFSISQAPFEPPFNSIVFVKYL